ncbi:MAG: hypothetical protein ACOY0T_03195 [Myxococcota bacterium]
MRFGCGRAFDREHPVWRAYVAGLEDSGNARDWTYEFYLREPEANTEPPIVAAFGCFAYAIDAPRRIRLHFRNAEVAGHSPLHHSRVDQRIQELRTLFEHVRVNLGDGVDVAGTSWLYNLQAYRRLLPASYVSSATTVVRLRSMPVWGQFLDFRARVKPALAHQFRLAIADMRSAVDVHRAFPFQPLAVCASVEVFYEAYGICVVGAAQRG